MTQNTQAGYQQTTRVLCAIGTRPEAIKMAPVILRLRKEPALDVRVLSTGQHREILQQMLGYFGIEPNLELNIMRPGQSLAQLNANLLRELDHVLGKESPDLVIAQGDTTTTFSVALAAFYRKIPFAHVEAGLRSGSMREPFPEEMNRAVVSRLSCLHFAPTEQAAANLVAEAVDPASIVVTGNTVIDALFEISEVEPSTETSGPLLVVTAHRRENWGAPLRSIARAVRILSLQNPDLTVLFSTHPNPDVQQIAKEELGKAERVILSPPLSYPQFVSVMKQARLILSDSGGVQEEAPALGTPVLVLRHRTERPEAVEAGANILVGTEERSIVQTAQRLLDDPEEYERMLVGRHLYGDGKASDRIAEAVMNLVFQPADLPGRHLALSS